MGHHNKDHKQRQVISKYKFSRIFRNNLDKAGVAYRKKGGKVEESVSAYKVGSIVYAAFFNKEKSGLIYIRYSLEGDILDLAAFSPYNYSPTKAFLDMMHTCINVEDLF